MECVETISLITKDAGMNNYFLHSFATLPSNNATSPVLQYRGCLVEHTRSIVMSLTWEYGLRQDTKHAYREDPLHGFCTCLLLSDRGWSSHDDRRRSESSVSSSYPPCRPAVAILEEDLPRRRSVASINTKSNAAAVIVDKYSVLTLGRRAVVVTRHYTSSLSVCSHARRCTSLGARASQQRRRCRIAGMWTG